MSDLSLQLFQSLTYAAQMAAQGVVVEYDGDDAGHLFDTCFAALDEATLIKQRLLAERIYPYDRAQRVELLDQVRAVAQPGRKS